MKIVRRTSNPIYQKRYVPSSRRLQTALGLILLSTVLLCHSSVVRAADDDRTTVDSTSTVDEGSRAVSSAQRLPRTTADSTGTVDEGDRGVAAADDDWTTVGSTGTVDEQDRDVADFSGGLVTMKSGATGTLNIRYNVVSVPGLLRNNGVELGVRYRDNGPEARVVVSLKRISLRNGGVNTILTLDSNDFAASNGFRLETEVDCFLRFNFFNYAYFLDVTLTKTASSGSPALAIIQLASLTGC